MVRAVLGPARPAGKTESSDSRQDLVRSAVTGVWLPGWCWRDGPVPGKIGLESPSPGPAPLASTSPRLSLLVFYGYLPAGQSLSDSNS